jgi:hypothetical protein
MTGIETRPQSAMTMQNSIMKVYPAGAFVRVSEICRNPKTGQPGLLPITRSTWWKWVKEGKAPAARKLGAKTTVWSIEEVLLVATLATRSTPGECRGAQSLTASVTRNSRGSPG